MTARRALGEFGERVAAHHLEAAGLRVVARNVRVPGGEIDLLAEDGDELVFVEVRARRAADGGAAESITAPKRRQMWRCAATYCEQHAIPLERARLDAICIDLDARGAVASVAHLRGIEVE